MPADNNAAKNAISLWLKAVRKDAEGAAVGLAHVAFEDVLEHGPQYSGDFVANTRYDVGSPKAIYEPFDSEKPADPFHRGSPEAMQHARDSADWGQSVELGEPLFVSTTVAHDGVSYAWDIEEGRINLRPINAGADHIYRNAVRSTQHQYSRIDKAQLEALQKAHL